jgi:phospholipid/cholesterol/gamma-HCH transport system permease protein
LDALRVLGISPVDFLVVPRVTALVLMMPLLTLYAGVVGTFAGMVVAWSVFNVGVFEYYHEVVRALDLRQFAVGITKGTTYGALVGYAGCLRGMQCGRDAQAVGEATTSAVVTGILLIVVSASLLTILFQELGI